MRKICTVCIVMIIVLAVLPGCQTKEVGTPRYEGKHLIIGMVGEVPELNKQNVSFKPLSFSELKELRASSDFDAVIITKENLLEADDPAYSGIYKTSGIPFFFMESTKSYLPFVYDDLTYDDVPDLPAYSYATGYFQEGDQVQFWGFGLYNDELSKFSIEDVYTQIFETVESLITDDEN